MARETRPLVATQLAAARCEEIGGVRVEPGADSERAMAGDAVSLRVTAHTPGQTSSASKAWCPGLAGASLQIDFGG